MKVLSLLPLVDWLALAAFFALWIGYAWFARFWGIRQRSLIATTNRYRGFWMLQATARDPRMLDGVIVQNLSHTPSFFSSTSIIIIGGLFALLGTTDTMFVHLRLHTEFSVVDGTNRIDELVQAAAARRPARIGHHRSQQPVWCHQVLQGRRGKGVKPILGAEMFVEGEAGAAPSRMLAAGAGAPGLPESV
jgi:hypothetical protein